MVIAELVVDLMRGFIFLCMILFGLGYILRNKILEHKIYGSIVLFIILMSAIIGCFIYYDQHLTFHVPPTPVYPNTISISDPTIKEEILGKVNYIQATYQEITVSDPRPTVYAWYRETYQRLGWDYNGMNDGDELFFAAKSECYSYDFMIKPYDTERTQTYLLQTVIDPGRSCPSLPTIQP